MDRNEFINFCISNAIVFFIFYILAIAGIALFTAHYVKKIMDMFETTMNHIQGIMKSFNNDMEDISKLMANISSKVEKKNLSESQILRFSDKVIPQNKIKVGKGKKINNSTINSNIKLDDSFSKNNIWRMDKQINFGEDD